jgi:shikimate kinase
MLDIRPHIQIIALIGLSGAGKSSVGRELAQRLGWELLDIDAMVESAAGQRIPQIFAEYGEPHFRDLEAAALEQATSAPHRVVSTGAGAILRPSSRALLRERAFVIWLDAPTETLIARLHAHDEQRPLLSGDPAARITAQRSARAPLYTEIAHLRLETVVLSHSQVAQRILAALRP